MGRYEDPQWLEAFFDGGLYELEYAPFFSDDQTEAEAELIVDLLGLDFSAEVLDAACGHGRHALLIASHVKRLVGVDRSARFIDLASRGGELLDLRPPRCEFSVVDLRRLCFDSEFDAAYSFFTSWGYYSDEVNQEILSRIHRALRPGGRFLIELAARDGVVRNFREHDEGQLPDGSTVVVENRLDLPSGRVHAKRRYIREGETREIEIVHHLIAPDELVRLLRRVGFAEVRLHDGVNGGPVSLDSRRLIALAQVGS